MSNKFETIMSANSDEELVKILFVKKDDYQQEAVAAAQNELDRRKLTERQIEKALDCIRTVQKNDDDRADMPLKTGIKILVFIFPAVINFLFALIYKADGYERKTKEVWRWTLYGICFYITLFFVLVILVNTMS